MAQVSSARNPRAHAGPSRPRGKTQAQRTGSIPRRCPSRQNRGIPDRRSRQRYIASLPAPCGCQAGDRRSRRSLSGSKDVLCWPLFAPEAQVAGVFTTSKTASAPVEWCRALTKAGQARALVVNSGNANAFTGNAGMAASSRCCRHGLGFDWLCAEGRVHGVDRRHRRTASCRNASRRIIGATRPSGVLPTVGARQPSHHDDGHLPEARDRLGGNRRSQGDDQRDRKRFRHDRARHGDHAGICFY